MAQQVTNFGRFYTAIRAMSFIGDRDEVKRQIVWQYTNGRTESLKEMTRREYERCCDELERRNGYRDQLRKERSSTLRLMQKMGVDTADWSRVNALCRDNRIAGKEFYLIDAGEHRELRRKLRVIERKGGLRARPAERAREEVTAAASPKRKPGIYMVPMGPMGVVLN